VPYLPAMFAQSLLESRLSLLSFGSSAARFINTPIRLTGSVG
jgi:hypothetical protein